MRLDSLWQDQPLGGRTHVANSCIRRSENAQRSAGFAVEKHLSLQAEEAAGKQNLNSIGGCGQKHRLTIVVPVYNVAPYVRACMDSIRKQTCQHFDLIVVDDGSTDESGTFCKKTTRQLHSASFFSRPHEGISAARNFAITKVKTEYVLFVDGDDYLETDTVERLMRLIETCKPDLAVYGFFYETEKKTRYPVSWPDTFYQSREEMERHFPEIWNAGLMYSVCNKLFLVDVIRRCGLFFEKRNFGEDFAFCREYLRYCTNMALLECCLYHYICQRPDSLSTAYRPDLFEIRVKEHQELLRYFQDIACDHAQAQEYLFRRHIERVVGCIENECSPKNRKSFAEKWRTIRQILYESDTVVCAGRARLYSWKMKIAVWVIRRKWVSASFFMGCVMSVCRRRLPGLFMRLKMHR